MNRRGTWLTARVRRWLEAAEEKLTLKRCGGDEKCPWCRRWMNQFTGTHVREFSGGLLDEITCGSCTGTSVWKWELGFVYVAAGEPPVSSWHPSDFGDCEFIRQQIEMVRAIISMRAQVRASDFRTPGDGGDGVPVHEGPATAKIPFPTPDGGEKT